MNSMKLTDNYVNDLLENSIADSAYEMATVGYFREMKGNKPKGELIKVFTTDDSGRPQVHIHLKGASGELRSCVKLDEPEYFLHDTYKDKLTKSQIEGLINFFQSPSSQPVLTFNGVSYKLKTQWDFAILQWNLENQLTPGVWMPVEKDAEGFLIVPKMPDYTKLK